MRSSALTDNCQFAIVPPIVYTIVIGSKRNGFFIGSGIQGIISKHLA